MTAKKSAIKKTASERLIDKAVGAAVKEAASNLSSKNITGCNFVGVQFDGSAMAAISDIARGLEASAKHGEETAKALGDIARMMKANSVHIDAMLKIESGE